jgi:hypothetical protein
MRRADAFCHDGQMIIGKMAVGGNRRPIFGRFHVGNNNVTAPKANYSV